MVKQSFLSPIQTFHIVWKRYVETWEVFFILGIAFSLTAFADSIDDFGWFGGEESVYGSIVLLFIFIVGMVVALLANIVILRGVTNVSEPLSVETLEARFREAWSYMLRYLWLGFLSGLAIFGAAVALIVPAFVLGFLFIFSAIVFFAEEKRGLDALLRSWHYVASSPGALLWRMFLGILVAMVIVWILGILMSIFFGVSGGMTDRSLGEESDSLFTLVGTFLEGAVLVPLYILYLHELYKQAVHVAPREEDGGLRENRKKWIIASWALVPIGAIIFLGIIILLVGFVSIDSLLPIR